MTNKAKLSCRAPGMESCSGRSRAWHGPWQIAMDISHRATGADKVQIGNHNETGFGKVRSTTTHAVWNKGKNVTSAQLAATWKVSNYRMNWKNKALAAK